MVSMASEVRKPSKKCTKGTDPSMADKCATQDKSMHSCTVALANMARPVALMAMMS